MFSFIDIFIGLDMWCCGLTVFPLLFIRVKLLRQQEKLGEILWVKTNLFSRYCCNDVGTVLNFLSVLPYVYIK